MRTVILGIDGLVPELFFGSEEHEQVGALLGSGAYGLLEDVLPLDRELAWSIFESGQDAGSLGRYGRRDRHNRGLGIGSAEPSVKPMASTLKARKPKTVATRAVASHDLASASAILAELERVSDLLLAALDEEGVDLGYLRDGNLADFQMAHPAALAGEEGAEELAGLYRALDDLLGRIVQKLEPTDQLLLVSPLSLQARSSALRINDWLRSEGFLKLRGEPRSLAKIDEAEVDWANTRAFALGGHEARIYLNLAGRDEQGSVDPLEASALRSEIMERLERLVDGAGAPLPVQIVKPEEQFQGLEGCVPDLIVVLDGHACDASESISGEATTAHETRSESLGFGQGGAFLLLAPESLLEGEIPAARLEDLMPTLLQLRGHDPDDTMSGRSLLDGIGEAGRDRRSDEEAAQRRLRGLGYL